MSLQIKRTGFGQVEPNHLSAQRTGQIYAQLPAKSTISVLENGQFAKYDYENKEVNFTGVGEFMLVYNEVKLYDGWRETYKNFAMQSKNYTPGSSTITHYGVGPFPGQMVPRLFKTNVGDIFTTNCIKVGNTSGSVEVAGETLAVGDKLVVNSGGYLEKATIVNNTLPAGMVWNVVKETTMPDNQPAVKIQRIQ